ncbi:MAG: ABC transporter ATP-binding protein [Chloroflexi bacterium]|nr:ABC transporter ATP-binding protein [Chloroflexota bacterium]
MKHLLRASAFLKAYRWQAVGAFVCLLLANAASLIQPQFTRLIVDTGIGTGNMRTVIWMSMAMIGFALLRSVFTFLQGVLMARTAQGIAYDARNQLYAKIQALSFSYHDRAQTGQLMTRATSDVDMVQRFVGNGFLMMIGAAVMMIGSLVLLFVTNWQLSLVMVVIVPFTFAVFGNIASRIRPLFKVVQERLARLNTVLQENLVGVRVVKAFVREPYELQRYTEANQELYDINIQIGRWFSLFMPLIFFISNIALLSVYWIGGGQVIRGTLTVGEMLSFTNYMMMAFFPMLMVTMIITMLSQAGASAERIFEVLDAQSEVVEKPDARELPSVRGEVAFEGVSFRYFEHGDPVLDDVSLRAEPGQVVALLGATGSGKSTIINLIPRFYDVTEGRVTVDGIDVRDVAIEDLRSQIGIVFQETTLFAGTIKENIAFGRPDAAMEEIVDAAQAAEAHDFISEFPDGYETMVGERGVTLSGGQKQRVAIARALLLNPRILILDDSTSSVDLETEYRIQKALDRLMEGRTSFVIAQRIATVLNADQILVLDGGNIVAQGVHEELMASSEIYADIYDSQLLQGADVQAEGSSAGDALGVLGPGHMPRGGNIPHGEGMRQRRGLDRSGANVRHEREEA